MADAPSPEDYLFDVMTPIGFRVHVTRAYWQVIATVKHPAIAGRENDVKDALQDPSAIRQSKGDPAVNLFYRPDRPGRWICAVAKRLNGEGFLITAYPTDAIKEGELIWPR